MIPTVRPPAVAGIFYPADPRELGDLLDVMLAGVSNGVDAECPVAVIVPHAGYVYSGPVAASVYARLARWRSSISRVVVIGPAHLAFVDGLAVPSVGAFSTPLGTIGIDPAGRDALLAHPGVLVDDEAHRSEHSVEVHLPFLQRVLGDGWTLVPVLAGHASAEGVADALAPLWGSRGTLVVVSTDLSHYHDLATARRLDRDTAATIVARSWELLSHDRACGATPVRGALELARRFGQFVELVDLRTSADTFGPLDHVVGYGSFVVR